VILISDLTRALEQCIQRRNDRREPPTDVTPQIAEQAGAKLKDSREEIGNSYVTPRWAKISSNLAKAPVDCDAILVDAELQPALRRELQDSAQPGIISGGLHQQSRSLTAYFNQRRF